MFNKIKDIFINNHCRDISTLFFQLYTYSLNIIILILYSYIFNYIYFMVLIIKIILIKKNSSKEEGIYGICCC